MKHVAELNKFNYNSSQCAAHYFNSENYLSVWKTKDSNSVVIKKVWIEADM